MNLYLKIFLYIFLLYGTISGIISRSIINGLYGGLFWGIIIALTFGILHKWSVKKMGYKISEKTTSPYQTRNFVLRLPYDKAFELCHHAIYSIKRGRVKMHDKSQGIIDARTGMKWNRNPCIISLKLRKIENNKTHIELSSKPLIPIGVVDFGTSLENVNVIIHFLKKHENLYLANDKKVSRRKGSQGNPTKEL